MNARQIHNTLLSLFIRGLGIWLLFDIFSPSSIFYPFIDNLYQVFFQAGTNVKWSDVFLDVYLLIWRLAAAAYLMLGAPPFLKLMSRDSAP